MPELLTPMLNPIDRSGHFFLLSTASKAVSKSDKNYSDNKIYNKEHSYDEFPTPKSVFFTWLIHLFLT